MAAMPWSIARKNPHKISYMIRKLEIKRIKLVEKLAKRPYSVSYRASPSMGYSRWRCCTFKNYRHAVGRVARLALEGCKDITLWYYTPEDQSWRQLNEIQYDAPGTQDGASQSGAAN